MIDLNREQFEKLTEIRKIMNENGIYFMNHSGWYEARDFKDFEYEQYINGAWYAFQKQQKKLDCCREENKAHLEKIDELQARINSLTNINESLVAYKNQLLDELEEKGNKDEN